MADLRNVPVDLARFQTRVWVARGLIGVLFAVLLVRLVYLQVLRYDDLFEQAESNRTAIVPIVPNRGLIKDRNGIVLATNYSAYTLEVTPAKTKQIDQLIEQLGQIVAISPKDRKRFRKLMEESKGFESLPLRTRLTDEEVARFAAQQYRFPEVKINARLYRNYPFGTLGSHVIGYIGRINVQERERLDDSDDQSNYRGTEHIGKLGIEQAYEQQLHGTTGVEIFETSAGGKAVRRLKNRPALPGENLTLAIDIKLQHLVETLFGERRGALVALNPNNGEVLALVSKPGFDPNLFVDGIDVESWRDLNESPEKPLLNRALRGTYPPGSTYKPFMAMAALQTGARTATAIVNDTGSWMLGDHRFRSHGETGLGPVDMHRSIVKSSNVYYYSLANELGVEAIYDFMKPLGFGQFTGIDLQGEVRGVLPNAAWKRATYRKPEQQKWYAGETISLGIGQGYNAFTMLQLAQATSTLVNGGYRHKPRVLIGNQDPLTQQSVRLPIPEPENLKFKPEHVAIVKRALVGVTQEGTSARAFMGALYQSGGKTGTAQAITIGQKEKYQASKLDEAKRDHALYMAYAPAENPQIVVAIVVENAGFGAEHAAPIARRVFDYWVKGLYPNPHDIAAVQKGLAPAPVGKPINAADVVLIPGETASPLGQPPVAPK